MTGCSKPLDFVKNKIFFFGPAEAAKPDARIRARTHLETVSFFSMIREHNTELLAAEAGQPFTFDRVLLVNNDGQVKIGAPTVAQASVIAEVVEHRRGPKKITFKMKRRKGYHKTIGHRQDLTVVKIKEIKA